jgi:glycosyltransferase involved in cell wall biosynthesis
VNIWILNHYALPPDLPGGTRHFDLASELTRRWGHKLTILASAFSHKLHREVRLDCGRTWNIESTDGVSFVWIRTFAYQDNDWRRVLNMVSFMARTYLVGRILPEEGEITRPDVIIGSSVHLLAVVAAYLLSLHFKAHFVMEVRDLWPETLVDMGALSERSLLTKCMRRLERFLYEHAERIIVLLPKAGKYMTDLGIQADKIHWIPNGVRLDRDPKHSSQELSDRPFTVMYVGAHGHANALKVLLEAAGVVAFRGYSDIHFVFVGDGPVKPELVAYKQARDLISAEFRDSVMKSEVPAVLQGADVLALVLRDLPVYRYGISLNKLFDYLAAGRPIVLAGNPINNVVREAQCGLTVPPDDPGALADAIIQLRNMSSKERQAMGARGRAHVEQHYDIRVLAERLHHMFEDLVNEGPTGH